jgi:ADP-ribose pyrophosphatase
MHNPILFEEKTIHTEPIFKGKIITVEVDTVTLPNGKQATRELVRHLGAVCVVAVVDDKILLVEQYRKPLGKSIIEVPAGKLDSKEEDPLACAIRELKEETGYVAGSMRKLYSFYSAPGFCDELIHVYLAEDLVAGDAKLDEDEFLNVLHFSYDEALQAIADTTIQDAKTILAVQAWGIARLTKQWP